MLVEVTEVTPLPVELVWNVINDVESYPRLMEHVRSLTVLERGPDFRVVAWEVDLKGCTMRWVEREEIDPERYRIEYRQIKGDLAVFEGYWQLQRLPNQTCQTMLSVRFDIGIPMLSEMLNPVAERTIRDNSQKMLASLGAHAVHLAAQTESVPETR
jgi:ribosome-associated toxin RatA of RatAB toxin-antitoxin module